MAKHPILSIQPLNQNPTFDDLDGPAAEEPNVEQAFAQTPAAVFDLELPWENDCGRIKNKYGVVVAKFENWEQADAVCAMMNGSQAMLDAVAAINSAAPPAAPTVDVEVAKAACDDQVDAMTFGGIPLAVDPTMPEGVVMTQDEIRTAMIEAAKQVFPQRTGRGLRL